MNNEIPALQDALRAIAKEIYPCRVHHIDRVNFSDEVLFLGIYLERQLAKKIDKLPDRWLEGSESGPTARPRRKG